MSTHKNMVAMVAHDIGLKFLTHFASCMGLSVGTW
jgi:hypothetical protein